MEIERIENLKLTNDPQKVEGHVQKFIQHIAPEVKKDTRGITSTEPNSLVVKEEIHDVEAFLANYSLSTKALNQTIISNFISSPGFFELIKSHPMLLFFLKMHPNLLNLLCSNPMLFSVLKEKPELVGLVLSNPALTFGDKALLRILFLRKVPHKKIGDSELKLEIEKIRELYLKQVDGKKKATVQIKDFDVRSILKAAKERAFLRDSAHKVSLEQNSSLANKPKSENVKNEVRVTDKLFVLSDPKQVSQNKSGHVFYYSSPAHFRSQMLLAILGAYALNLSKKIFENEDQDEMTKSDIKPYVPYEQEHVSEVSESSEINKLI